MWKSFKLGGPLNRHRHPIKSKKGQTYWKWRGQLEALGYKIETKELIAADYGAPTKRKRFFMVARCDGKPIVWPKPTHGDRNSDEVKKGLLKPYVAAAKIIDWDIPCKSIFGRKKPLAENTMKRIARRTFLRYIVDTLDCPYLLVGYIIFFYREINVSQDKINILITITLIIWYLSVLIELIKKDFYFINFIKTCISSRRGE